MGQQAPLKPSVITLTSAVLLAVSCPGLIPREKLQAPLEARPQTQLGDDRDAEEPTHQAPPPDYGHRVVQDELETGKPKRKRTKATAPQGVD